MNINYINYLILLNTWLDGITHTDICSLAFFFTISIFAIFNYISDRVLLPKRVI